MVYISGEEMTKYTMDLILAKWINPYIDTSAWEFYDLSCNGRDKTDDKVLKDAIEAGKRVGSIFKEPTITPTAIQVRFQMKKNSIYNTIVFLFQTIRTYNPHPHPIDSNHQIKSNKNKYTFYLRSKRWV